mmetsp:Transcript_71236/g.125335  ORF Transcript_71236/g.125335 Transcript_71236/m.125335 type:complete len:204 (+) Transcript_71236:2032-2643(+)
MSRFGVAGNSSNHLCIPAGHDSSWDGLLPRGLESDALGPGVQESDKMRAQVCRQTILDVHLMLYMDYFPLMCDPKYDRRAKSSRGIKHRDRQNMKIFEKASFDVFKKFLNVEGSRVAFLVRRSRGHTGAGLDAALRLPVVAPMARTGSLCSKRPFSKRPPEPLPTFPAVPWNDHHPLVHLSSGCYEPGTLHCIAHCCQERSYI